MPQRQDVQDDFSFGIVRGVGPQAIDPRACFDHVNGLYEEDGGAYARGGSSAHSEFLQPPASHPLVWMWAGYFDVGQRTIAAATDNFHVLDSNDEDFVNLGSDGLTFPVASAFLEGALYIGGGYIYGGSRKTAAYSTGTVTATNGSKVVTGSGTTWNTLVDAGMLFQAATSERVYVVDSIDSTTQITLRDAYEGTTGGGKSYSLNHIYKMVAADPYEIGAFYAVCSNRLLTATENVVKFTEIQRPHKWTLTAGEPPAEIPNEHAFAEGSRVTGFGVIGQSVIVLTTGGIWTLDGIAFDIVDSNGNSNHRVQVLSRELHAYGLTSTWNQALLVPCLSGIFLIDGVSAPRRVSHPLEPLYQDYVDASYMVGQGAVHRDHYVLPIVTTTATVRDILVARLDRPIQVSGQDAFPWARQAGDGVACPTFFERVSTSGETLLLGANKPLAQIVDCSPWFSPSPGTTLDADDAAPQWVLITRDYTTGGLTENMVRSIRPRYELVGDGAELESEYGFGARAPGPLIGQVEFGGFAFGVESELFFDLDCLLDESDGLDPPKHCLVNVPARFIRYRFSSNDPRSSLRFRSLEQFTRESGAVRH